MRKFYHPTKIEIMAEIGDDALCWKSGGHSFVGAAE
jgi:hypothetical protein